ncbi:hypothetical protein NP493_456g02029 [Ridgeia piscesae]|uniref:Uncharacterized protein n=1 Tax=Ridgeia piscesae TaxID=27915 RepID=A0AAD9KZF7_RIDPI|nr:hypothetical protein NP493_456g02029 [Ridgeia piscesae]
MDLLSKSEGLLSKSEGLLSKSEGLLSKSEGLVDVDCGIRGLCNGLGPALYGIVFYLFHVDLNQSDDDMNSIPKTHLNPHRVVNVTSRPEPSPLTGLSIMPGPPFAFGAILVILAILVAVFIPDSPHQSGVMKSPTRRSPPTALEHFQRDTG